jgi:hypothetical protein
MKNSTSINKIPCLRTISMLPMGGLLASAGCTNIDGTAEHRTTTRNRVARYLEQQPRENGRSCRPGFGSRPRVVLLTYNWVIEPLLWKAKSVNKHRFTKHIKLLVAQDQRRPVAKARTLAKAMEAARPTEVNHLKHSDEMGRSFRTPAPRVWRRREAVYFP